MSLTVFSHPVALLALASLLPALQATAQKAQVLKQADGIVIHLPQVTPDATRTLRLQVVSSKILHVQASPLDTVSSQPSLMVVPQTGAPVKWQYREKKGQGLLSTDDLTATVSLTTGEIRFADAKGQPILLERKNGGKTFAPTTADGQRLYQIEQVFESPLDEGLYGLGQHQNGTMNYRGQQVELAQNNTDVAVPFLVSSRNYGILWDNYSITKVSDTRDYEPLSTLQLYAADGTPGWLTATYVQKKNPKQVIVQRPESVVEYEYLEDQKNFPAGLKLDQALATWEGSVASGVAGKHHFLLKNAGYVKLYLDGKLVVDKWRQAWNPGTSVVALDMVPGRKYALKMEWDPDGGESYLGLKWLGPLAGQSQLEYGFKSEAGPDLNYYFVRGSTPDEVIAGYRQLTGPAPMMPKWALGLWQSRERYKTQAELLDVAAEFRKRQIPLDNIVLDWSYWKPAEWGSQEFDPSRFPNPDGMVKTLHERDNLHFMISVWAKIYEGIPVYNDFKAKGYLYPRNIANRTKDWIAPGYTSTFYDAFNPKARSAFWDLMNTKLFAKGVDAWWMDASEPDIYSNTNVRTRKALMAPSIGSSTQYFNAFPLQNAKGIYEGQRATAPNQRVFLLTRSGYAGSQRYAAAIWSGDIASRWEDFKNQIPAGLNFSLSGIPYWTSDIGGFAVERRYEKPNATDLEEWRELNARWFQYGAFCPLFRVHGQFPFREIYNIAPAGHPAYQSMLYYDQLRYRLMPYIYSLAGQAHHQHGTIMRGLMMDFGADPSVKNVGDEFLYGPSLLVAPVTDYRARSREVYLPAGTGWFDFHTGQYQAGGQKRTVEAPLERMPLFVREGSIVPFGPALQYAAEKVADPITLYVYTGRDAQFTLYEDENVNYNYEKGAFATIPLSYNEKTKTLTVGERQGTFPGMAAQRTFRVVWVGKNKPAAFDADAQPAATLSYSGSPVTARME
ncbi:TIM-barrel domain-containing protein [Hymenobacter arizonensis]|uniref:Alpha-D-xyloside xylohydrolase n=1 Tax=Hymenobacter arizonensis TaxID=1227077 RepID=A0A1I6A7M6_HYMAR|nr:TIM-barrel domain-containing protein [Hymenobacter arizonensis]SFQ64736.1 alpha-D-xyloside xylohydrolase [Hymenobacter arizonensis]